MAPLDLTDPAAVAKAKASLKLPMTGITKKKSKKAAEPTGAVLSQLEKEQLSKLLNKSSYQLESDDFLLTCPNIVKELDLTSNSLTECLRLSHMGKLKKLALDKNNLRTLSLNGLVSLVFLSLSQNRLEHIPDMADLKQLINLDLSMNRIALTDVRLLDPLKGLRVLDLSNNEWSTPIQNFYHYVLQPLKKLPKLEYLAFYGNPVCSAIDDFRMFVVFELPKLKYLDWMPVTKEERSKAAQLEKKWEMKTAPVARRRTVRSTRYHYKDRRDTGSSQPDAKGLMIDNLLQTGGGPISPRGGAPLSPRGGQPKAAGPSGGGDVLNLEDLVDQPTTNDRALMWQWH